MHHEASFPQLLERLRGGEEETWAEFEATYGPHVRRVVARQMRNQLRLAHVGASDICQSAFTRLFKALKDGKFQDSQSFEHLKNRWLKIARNRLIDHFRGLHAHGDAVDQIEDRGLTPSQVAEMEERVEMVEKVRGFISPEERQLWTLRADGESWQEIAETLGGTPAQRRQQFLRLRLRIREQLESEGESHAAFRTA